MCGGGGWGSLKLFTAARPLSVLFNHRGVSRSLLLYVGESLLAFELKFGLVQPTLLQLRSLRFLITAETYEAAKPGALGKGLKLDPLMRSHLPCSANKAAFWLCPKH